MLTVLLFLMALCNSLPCLPGLMTDALFLQINIGFIVDVHSEPRAQGHVTILPCNITIEWHHVHFGELFQVFRTINILDQRRDDVDLIVLLDYDKYSTPSALIKTENKRLIEINSRSTAKSQTQLKSLILKFTGATLNTTVENDQRTPYCRTWRNQSYFEDSRTMGDSIITTPSEILAQLVGKQGWKFISVLHDTPTEYETRLFVDSVSQHGSVFTIYNVDQVKNVHGMLFDLYHKAVKIEHNINIVVLAKLDTLINVFHTANKFDGLNKEYPTLLKQFSRWIAVVYDYNTQVASLLQTVARDLDNVAILPVPELRPPTAEGIVTRLHELTGELYTHAFMNESERKSFYVQRISREFLLLEPAVQCSHYVIDTLCWAREGREFQTVGNADLDGEVQLTSELFPNTKYGYSRRQFRVTTEIYEPYVSERTTQNNKTIFGGIYIDLLEELARVLNFTYTIVLPPDRKWGSVDRTENGRDIFNGIIGMLQRHEVDFAAGPLTIIPARDKVVDFTYPVSHEYTTVIVKKPDPNATKWRTLINPFKLEVLLYIGLALPIVTILVFLIEKFGAFYNRPEHAVTRKERGGLHHLHDSFWYMYGALLYQGGIRLPDSFAGRTFVSSWWIFCIIIVGIYCGNLIAFLTVSKVVPPFNTLDEMLSEKGNYKWGTLGGAVWETIFTTSKNPSFRRVGAAMKEFNESDPNIFHISEDFHKERVKRGGYGWIIDATTTELLMSSACDLTTIKEKVLPMKDAFAFQQNSPHTVIFSEQIMKAHEAGLFEIWRKKWLPKTNFCADSAKLEAKTITLRDVQSAFYLCLVGFFFGTLAFGVEVVVYRVGKRRQGRRKPEQPAHDMDGQLNCE